MKWFVVGIKIWWPVASVLLAAVFVIVSGIWGADFVGGNADAFSNALRSLQWETMTAGLFGLAGGCLVLVATRQQIQHVKRHAIEQAVDQELSPYFQIEADIRYLLEDFKNIVEAARTWQEVEDINHLDESETVSFLILLNRRMNKMSRDENTPLVIRKGLSSLWTWGTALQRKKKELVTADGKEIICKILVVADCFHEVVMEHRKRLIRARIHEF